MMGTQIKNLPDNPNLYREYFLDKNNNYIPFVTLLDCYQAPLYFILKNKIEDIGSPYELFLQDTTYQLYHNPDKTWFDFDLTTEWDPSSVFDIKKIRTRGHENFSKIKEMLNQNEIVMFETHPNRAPIFKYFSAKEAPCDEFEKIADNNHIFTALAFEENKLYYVEHPNLVNDTFFVPFNGNKSIGIIDIGEMYPAFDGFLFYFTVSVKPDSITAAANQNKLIDSIRSTILNYDKKPCVINDRHLYYNKDALATLKRFFNEGVIQLGEKQNFFNCFCDLLCWKMECVRQKRFILLQCVKQFLEKKPIRDAGKFVLVLQKNVNVWQFLVNIFRIKSRQKKLSSFNAIVKCLDRISDSEDVLIDAMGEFIAATGL